jgi:hypothetical protein
MFEAEFSVESSSSRVVAADMQKRYLATVQDQMLKNGPSVCRIVVS